MQNPEKELLQNYVEDQLLIKHGLQLLKEKFTSLNRQTNDGFLKEYYNINLPRIEKLLRVTEQNIISPKYGERNTPTQP